MVTVKTKVTCVPHPETYDMFYNVCGFVGPFSPEKKLVANAVEALAQSSFDIGVAYARRTTTQQGDA